MLPGIGPRALFFPLLIWLTTFFAALPVHAYLLDWDSLTWTNGSLSNTYNNVNGSGVNVTVTISGSTGQLIAGPNAGNPTTPYLTNSIVTGGLSPAQNSLFILADYSNLSQQLVVTVSFSQAVRNVSYTLFDVDYGDPSGAIRTFTDEISNVTSTNGSSTFASTVITGATQATTGTGTGLSVYGTGIADPLTANGNLTIDHGTNFANSVTFTYGSRDATSQTNPSQQGISLHDISFEVIPEPAWGVAMIGVGALAIFWHRRSRVVPVNKEK